MYSNILLLLIVACGINNVVFSLEENDEKTTLLRTTETITSNSEEDNNSHGRNLDYSWTLPTSISKADCTAHGNTDSVTCTQLSAMCKAKFNIEMKWVGSGCSRQQRSLFCPKVPPSNPNACLNNGDGGCRCKSDATGAPYQYCGYKCKSECQKRAGCRWIEGALGGCRTWDGTEYIQPRICPATTTPPG
jgi:hypothetical protein